jgi:hypothetical protein
MDQIPSKADWSKGQLQVVERDEQGRAYICIDCMSAVRPWGSCYRLGHEVAPIQNIPKFPYAN